MVSHVDRKKKLRLAAYTVQKYSESIKPLREEKFHGRSICRDVGQNCRNTYGSKVLQLDRMQHNKQMSLLSRL